MMLRGADELRKQEEMRPSYSRLEKLGEDWLGHVIVPALLPCLVALPGASCNTGVEYSYSVPIASLHATTMLRADLLGREYGWLWWASEGKWTFPTKSCRAYSENLYRAMLHPYEMLRQGSF